MSILDSAVDIQELGQRNLWVIYGKSNSGKTCVSATFPKPLLYLQIGDDGSNTIAGIEGIKAIPLDTVEKFRDVAKELADLKRPTYKTVVVDTFSLLTAEWTDINIVQKKKRMTQQSWGDLKTDT